jgi:hypothetical protein
MSLNGIPFLRASLVDFKHPIKSHKKTEKLDLSSFTHKYAHTLYEHILHFNVINSNTTKHC